MDAKRRSGVEGVEGVDGVDTEIPIRQPSRAHPVSTAIASSAPAATPLGFIRGSGMEPAVTISPPRTRSARTLGLRPLRNKSAVSAPSN